MPVIKAAKTSRKPIQKRYQRARTDASIEAIQGKLEKAFGLPSGSVRLVYPGGRKMPLDFTVGDLRSRWGR